jgi:CheY-like chemotaxis protein
VAQSGAPHTDKTKVAVPVLALSAVPCPSVMTPAEDDFTACSALVIDANDVSRRTLAGMLRNLGVGRIEQAARPQEARDMLDIRGHDIVLCDYHFPDQPVNGQELVEDLRQSGLLPLRTIVVMISGESNYGVVAEAAEVALDAYLLKPHTEAALRQRLLQARARKQALHGLLQLIEQEAFEPAAQEAQRLVDTRAPAWLEAARIGVDLYLRLGRGAQSLEMLGHVIRNGALPWSRLGLAQPAGEPGAGRKPRRTLESLIGEAEGYNDAFDLMCRSQLEQGEAAAAVETLQQAARLTPSSVPRLIKLGLLNFCFGNGRTALDALQRATRIGLNHRVYDLEGLVLLGLLQFDTSDERGLTASTQMLARIRGDVGQSARLERFERVLKVMLSLQQRHTVDALGQLTALLGAMREPDFDVEAAVNLLAVLARLTRSELQLGDLDHHVGQLALRFAVSRSTTDLMCATVGDCPQLVVQIRTSHERIGQSAEQAVARTLAGEPAAAAQDLLQLAEQTLNAKLMDLAQHTLLRHHARIGEAAAAPMIQRLQQLVQTYRSYGTQVRAARLDDLAALAATMTQG